MRRICNARLRVSLDPSMAMDRDFLIDLFSGFGPVTIRRMFSGFGISADGTNFALALRSGIYLRADEHAIPLFEAEGSRPFSYQTRTKTVTVGSYWQLPERLYDDPEGLADWAKTALAAAQRAALGKRKRGAKAAKKPVRKPAMAAAKNTPAKKRRIALAKRPVPANTRTRQKALRKRSS
jgi:DNA transformation protein